MKYKKALYIFTRDLRIQDNQCWCAALENSETVYPVFILTNDQIKKNKYKNTRAIDFMCRTVLELAGTIPICIFEGNLKLIIKYLVYEHGIDAVYINRDVTPYAKYREGIIKEICPNVILGRDHFLGREHDLRKADETPYMIFTAFYNNAIKKINVGGSTQNEKSAVSKQATIKKISAGQNINLLKKYIINWKSPFIPGRAAAEASLKKYVAKNPQYNKVRDAPALHGTSHLSAYLHYGVISSNECAAAFKKISSGCDLIRQLLWREFYMYIIDYSHVDYSKLSRSIPARNKIKWKNNAATLKKWQEGKTGIPWIDAAMTQLNETGYMENRLRMNVAMFLIFYLQIDWREGEMYFAKQLVDYDYCNNLGGWLWSAAWEVHSNEYYRCFSMESQMKRFDKDAEYVKKWLPIYKDIPAKHLYDWPKYYDHYKIGPVPVIKNLKEARQAGIELYRISK